MSSEETFRDEVFLHGEHVEAGRALVQVAHVAEVPAAGGVRAPVRGGCPRVGRAVGPGSGAHGPGGAARADERAALQRCDAGLQRHVRLIVPQRASRAGEGGGGGERRHPCWQVSFATRLSCPRAVLYRASRVPAASARRTYCCAKRFKKTKKPKNQPTRFFYGFKSGQWAYGHSVREAKKRPLTASQTEERRLSDRPVSRRDAAFSAWYRPEIAPSALLRKKKVGARGNRGRLSPARAPRGSHASPKMAEDNSARLQAMQDAVTDAGNDVRALKVCHAPGSFLYRLRHADRASISRNVASPTDPPGPRFRSPD